MRAAFALVAAVAAAGCGGGTGRAGDDDDDDDTDAGVDGTGDPCTAIIGDLSRPVEVVPLVGLRDGTGAIELADGGDVDLIPPFQGGFILLAGGKVRNIDGCTAGVTASLREPGTGQVVGLEQRPSHLLLGDDGWGHPSGLTAYALANVAVCPNLAGNRDIQDLSWQLEVRYASADLREGTATRMVVPRCAADDPDCPCMCDADFEGGCAAPGD